MMKHIVKARKKTKNKFLDLTLPVEIRKKYSINHGDLFKIDVIMAIYEKMLNPMLFIGR